MIGLTYHPLYDPHHCIFRLLCLFHFSGELDFEDDRLRIIDFYLLNPFLIKSIELTKDLRDRLNQMDIHKINLPYQDLPNSRALFSRLEPVQRVSIRHMVGLGLISRQRLLEGYVRPTFAVKLSKDLSIRIADYVNHHNRIFAFLIRDLAHMPLAGKDGLKRRTELMEYKYDAE